MTTTGIVLACLGSYLLGALTLDAMWYLRLRKMGITPSRYTSYKDGMHSDNHTYFHIEEEEDDE